MKKLIILKVENGVALVSDGKTRKNMKLDTLNKQLKEKKIEIAYNDGNTCKAVKVIRDKDGKPVAYDLKSMLGKHMLVVSDALKFALLNHSLNCLNMSISKDGRLFQSSKADIVESVYLELTTKQLSEYNTQQKLGIIMRELNMGRYTDAETNTNTASSDKDHKAQMVHNKITVKLDRLYLRNLFSKFKAEDIARSTFKFVPDPGAELTKQSVKDVSIYVVYSNYLKLAIATKKPDRDTGILERLIYIWADDIEIEQETANWLLEVLKSAGLDISLVRVV